MVYKTRNRQLYVATEPFPGDAFVPGSYLKTLRVINPQITLEQGEIENEEARPGLGTTAPRAGVQLGSLTFEMDMAGKLGGNAGNLKTAPEWGPLMQSCGFRSRPVEKITIASLPGGARFKAGAVFQADDSDATGVIMESIDESSGALTLYYSPLTGTITSADTELTIQSGSFAGVVATISSQTPADAGVGYIPSKPIVRVVMGSPGGTPWPVGTVFVGPVSRAILRLVEAVTSGSATVGFFELLYGRPQAAEVFTDLAGRTFTFTILSQWANNTVSIGINEDGRLKMLRGARGEVTFRMTSALVPRMVFNFRGVLDNVTQDVLSVAGGYAGATPPRFVSAYVRFGAAAVVEPILDQIEVQVQNGLEMREDATSPQGRREALGLRRQIAVTMNPEAIPQAAFNAYAFATGKTAFPISARWGNPGVGNAFRLRLDDVVAGTVNSGDRGGKMTDEWQAGAYQTDGEDEMTLLVV